MLDSIYNKYKKNSNIIDKILYITLMFLGIILITDFFIYSLTHVFEYEKYEKYTALLLVIYYTLKFFIKYN